MTKKILKIINWILYLAFGIVVFKLSDDLVISVYFSWILIALFFVWTLINFEFLLRKIPCLYPYKNLIPFFLGFFYSTYFIIFEIIWTMNIIRSEKDTLDFLTLLLMGITPMIFVGLPITILGFLFDGIYKLIKKRKALKQ